MFDKEVSVLWKHWVTVNMLNKLNQDQSVFHYYLDIEGKVWCLFLQSSTYQTSDMKNEIWKHNRTALWHIYCMYEIRATLNNYEWSSRSSARLFMCLNGMWCILCGAVTVNAMFWCIFIYFTCGQQGFHIHIHIHDMGALCVCMYNDTEGDLSCFFLVILCHFYTVLMP